MKKIFLFFIAFYMLFPLLSLGAENSQNNGFYDLDFKFIDNPFSGQKVITDSEYQKSLSQYKQRAEKKKNGGFWNWVMKHTIPKDKQRSLEDNTPSSSYSDEIKYQKEMLSQKPSIALSDTIIDSNGKTVKQGFYQVTVEDFKLKLIQGYDTIGTLNARKTTDNWDKNKIIYARIVYQGEDVLKIIYSNLDECYEAYAVVKKEN